MNRLQWVRQVEYRARSLRWPGGKRVLGDVVTTSGVTAEVWQEIRHPFLLVAAGNSTPDVEHPDSVEHTLRLTLVQSLEGDRVGRIVMVGGRQAAGAEHLNRGLLEIEGALLEALLRETGQPTGAYLRLRYAGAVDTGQIEGRKSVAYASYTLSVLGTATPYYTPPRNLRREGGFLKWDLPGDRWDLHEVVLRAGAGSVPADPEDGTPVVLGSALPSQVADPGGTHFAIFAGYDESYNYDGAPSVSEAWSAQEWGTTISP